MRTHYPRTPHLPWSPGSTSDDVRAGGVAGLFGREVVVTEKLDGENTTLYRDGSHARSLDSGHHPSRSWVKGLQARIGPHLPVGWRICGENVHARHSLAYDALDSWFYGFSVWDGDRCLSWDATTGFLHGIGVPTPPVLYRGDFSERLLRRLRVDTSVQEGYVVRAAQEFDRADFAHRVAKWVRPSHVRTDVHWMSAPVVPNGLSPRALLWDLRSGAPADPDALAATTGLPVDADALARLDPADALGDRRLAAVLATALHAVPRARLAAELAGLTGLPLSRRIADLAGLHRGPHREFPDGLRRSGLLRLATAVDLGVLHTVSAALAPDAAARENTAWSALHADELGPRPFAELRAGLLAESGSALCWADGRDRSVEQGRVLGVEEAVAATWRLRGPHPELLHLIGPSGSGKSTFGRGWGELVSLDELRAARGDRSDQSANDAIAYEARGLLDAALARGGDVVWDATSLTDQLRAPVDATARRRGALLTHVVALVPERVLDARDATRPHPVPAAVRAAQLRRYSPPYPWQAHRTWYLGESGEIEDDGGEP
ncbi:AAA family ATPase [Actinosynnema pretiosum subsp. pretiosum]|uniref:AAA family ATPase n=1 Tax=Actinosynnema pretiosum subsp. pretiosum TaxID=103721 RepID=A0AA45L9A2_9PSEU|nr:hypothetical protein APASM_3066 [Actinosynnema pretiosum subsp. pretiosum]QUF05423.1 AAA family ATPase [Actinosynnema pretiosum subsp. pretiosum]